MNDKRQQYSMDDLDKATSHLVKHKAKKTSKAVHKTFTFSLTQKVSDRIDDLTLIAPKVGRSDIIKASLTVFEALSKEEQVKIIKALKEKGNL